MDHISRRHILNITLKFCNLPPLEMLTLGIVNVKYSPVNRNIGKHLKRDIISQNINQKELILYIVVTQMLQKQ